MHFKLTTGGCRTLARFVCATIILVCDSAVSLAQEASQSGRYTATMEEICRQYATATAQTGRRADLMFQQWLSGIAGSRPAQQTIIVNRLGR